MTDRETLSGLKAAVQYRRKDGGHDWVTMAAFDGRGVAEFYFSGLARHEGWPWEYQVIDLDGAVGEGAPADGK
jgi:hypothetical protein